MCLIYKFFVGGSFDFKNNSMLLFIISMLLQIRQITKITALRHKMVFYHISFRLLNAWTYFNTNHVTYFNH